MTIPKVLFVTPVFEKVEIGPALYANLMWNSLRDSKRIDFHILAPLNGLGKTHTDPRYPNLHRFEVGSNSRQFYRSMQNAAIDLFQSTALRGAIFHGNVSHAMCPIAKVAKRSILQINDVDSAKGYSDIVTNCFRSGIRRSLSLAWRHREEQKAVRYVDHLLFNSSFVSRTFQQHYRLPQAVRTHVIHKGIDVARFTEPHSGTKKIPNDSRRNIAFIGSNWERKGLDLLVRSLQHLPGAIGDFRLVVIGEPTLGKEKVIQLVERYKLVDHVLFLGNVDRDELPSVLHQCHVSVLPSMNEAFGVSILESLASGLPVVASRSGGIPEILEHAKHSRLVERNPSQIVEGIVECLNQDEHMAKDEGKRIAANFSHSRMIDRICSLYQEIHEQGS